MSNFDPDISWLIVGEEDQVQIAACLQRLMADSGASYSMVIDRSGQILSEESDDIRPEMVHLGALIAATYASTQEMARILKEDGFKTLFQEGLKEKIFTETVRGRWLLVVIFNHQAQVGMVKVLARTFERGSGKYPRIGRATELRNRYHSLPSHGQSNN